MIKRILIALKLRKPEPLPMTPEQLRIAEIKADILRIAETQLTIKIRRPVKYKINDSYKT